MFVKPYLIAIGVLLFLPQCTDVPAERRTIAPGWISAAMQKCVDRDVKNFLKTKTADTGFWESGVKKLAKNEFNDLMKKAFLDALEAGKKVSIKRIQCYETRQPELGFVFELGLDNLGSAAGTAHILNDNLTIVNLWIDDLLNSD